jgi:hypothetical protein
MIFAATNLPPLPPSHELYPYATHMMNAVDQLYQMMWLWLVMKLMLVSFGA